MTIRYSRRALSQLVSVHEYLAARGEMAGNTVTASIERTVWRLQEMPLLGKLTDEPGVQVIIEPEYMYRVFYRIVGREVIVVRILHHRQL